jgi:hypothetical protein
MQPAGQMFFFNSTGPVFGAESVSLLFFVSFFYPRGSRIRRGRKSRTSRFRFLGSDFDGFLERIDRLIPPYFIEFFNHGLLLVLADDVVNTNRSSAVVRFNVFVVRRTLSVYEQVPLCHEHCSRCSQKDTVDLWSR